MLRNLAAFDVSFRPLTAAQAGTGRLLGGPPDAVATRLYGTHNATWPRLRLTVYAASDKPVVWALVKDNPDDAWDVIDPPSALREDVKQLLADAEAKLARERR